MRFDWILKLYAIYLAGYFIVRSSNPDFTAPIPVSWWSFTLLLLITVSLEFVFFRMEQLGGGVAEADFEGQDSSIQDKKQKKA